MASGSGQIFILGCLFCLVLLLIKTIFQALHFIGFLMSVYHAAAHLCSRYFNEALRSAPQKIHRLMIGPKI